MKPPSGPRRANPSKGGKADADGAEAGGIDVVPSEEAGTSALEPRPTGIWSRQTVRSKAKNLKLFTRPQRDTPYLYRDAACAFREEQLDYAGYILTMGPECYISPADADKRSSIRQLDEGEAFLVPPGQFAFLLTEEVVRVPDNAFAFIALRSTSKFKGLVNVSGFHADPGFLGRLVFAVFNAGPGDVHLRRGEPIFMISFSDLDAETEKPRANEINDREKSTRLHISSEIIMPLSGQIQSLAGLKDQIENVEDELNSRLNKIERDVAIMRWAFAAILGALATLLIRAIA
jgi:dCTP deaminase